MGVFAAFTLLVLGALVGPAPAAVADSRVPRGTDRATVAGYDLETDLPADVAARSDRNNLAVDVVVRKALSDGTITVKVPRRVSPTDLHPAGLLSRDDPGLPGSVVVRPLQPMPLQPVPDPVPARVRADGAGLCDTYDPQTISTSNTGRQHVAVVQHVTCRAGQRVSIRLAALEAPERPGVYHMTVAVSDAHGTRSHRRIRLRVVKKVTTRLTVETPAVAAAGVPLSLTVRAVRADGRPDRQMSGGVRLILVGGDCPDDPGFAPRFQFTRADAGVKVVTLTPEYLGVSGLAVESITRRAAPFSSAPFTVTGNVEDEPTCTGSVSYH